MLRQTSMACVEEEYFFISNKDSLFLYTFCLTFPISYFLIKNSNRFFRIPINLKDFGTNILFRYTIKCEQWNWHLNIWFWFNFTPSTIWNWFELHFWTIEMAMEYCCGILVLEMSMRKSSKIEWMHELSGVHDEYLIKPLEQSENWNALQFRI